MNSSCSTTLRSRMLLIMPPFPRIQVEKFDLAFRPIRPSSKRVDHLRHWPPHGIGVSSLHGAEMKTNTHISPKRQRSHLSPAALILGCWILKLSGLSLWRRSRSLCRCRGKLISLFCQNDASHFYKGSLPVSPFEHPDTTSRS